MKSPNFLCRSSRSSSITVAGKHFLSYNSRSIFVILLLSLICTSTEVAAMMKLAQNETFFAVHAFGDSVLDTGNNNNLKTISKCNFAPYGRDFQQGKPTGRFCNGRIISDFIAEALGIKEQMPSYHDLNLQTKDLKTGLSFASGGSGYDPLTSQLLQVFSQSDQLQFFKEYKIKLKGEVGEERSRIIIARSLYLLSSGHNDILFSYFATQLRKMHFDVPSYTDFLLRRASSFLRDLYKLGARKIAVFNVAPLGCLPFGRTLGGGIERICAEKINQAVQMFNAKLSSEIASLNHELRDSNFVFVDIYQPVLDLIQDPSKFGYEVVGEGCCSTGIVETGVFCNKLAPTCKNASVYLFWDAIHPTEGAYRIISSQILKQLF